MWLFSFYVLLKDYYFGCDGTVYDAQSAHPGLICVDILLETYDPAYSMRLILLAISVNILNGVFLSSITYDELNKFGCGVIEFWKVLRSTIQFFKVLIWNCFIFTMNDH